MSSLNVSRCMVLTCIGVYALISMMPTVLAAENLAPNPGMEEVTGVTDDLGNALSVPPRWSSQTLPYCRVTDKAENVHSGTRALELPADAYLNQKFPVVFGQHPGQYLQHRYSPVL